LVFIFGGADGGRAGVTRMMIDVTRH